MLLKRVVSQVKKIKNVCDHHKLKLREATFCSIRQSKQSIATNSSIKPNKYQAVPQSEAGTKRTTKVFSIYKNRQSVHSYKKFEIINEIKENKIHHIIRPHLFLSEEERMNKETIITKLIKQIKEFFLPKDYPYSVYSSYLNLSLYNFLSNFTYFYLNFIFMQITIESLGASVAQSVAASAGLNWALKEGIGQITSIFTVAKLGSLADKNAKEYRFYSTLILHVVFILELSIMVYPKYFVLLAGLSTLTKITAISLSVISRTTIFVQLAKKQNLMDLSIKFINQMNVAIFLGTGCAFITTLFVNITFSHAAIILFINNLICLAVNIRSYNNLVLSDFNFQRLYILSKKYISEKRLLNPKEVSRFERILFSMPTIKFGCTSPEFLIKQDKHFLNKILKAFENCNFVVFPKKKFMVSSLSRKYVLHTFLNLQATPFDILKAFFLSVRLEEILNFTSKYSEKEILDYIHETIEYTNMQIHNQLLEELDTLGWKYNFNSLEKTWSRYHIVNIEGDSESRI